MELTRKQIIDNLSYIADSMPDDACAEWRDSLAYAISSLKTDEAYQLMYEGGEVFTKDEVVAMLTEIKDEASNIRPTIGNCTSFAEGIRAYDKLIQQKINALKENKDGTN